MANAETNKSCSKCGLHKTGSHVSYCKDCYNEYKRKRYMENRGDEIRRVMDYNKRNYEKFKETLSNYRTKTEWKETRRNWERLNSDKVKQYDRTKRAKRNNAEGHHTHEDVFKILKNQNYRCAEPSCGVDISNGNYHVDHIMPLSRGGSNWASNLQCLCPPCNNRKWALLPEEWALKNGRLI